MEKYGQIVLFLDYKTNKININAGKGVGQKTIKAFFREQFYKEKSLTYTPH